MKKELINSIILGFVLVMSVYAVYVSGDTSWALKELKVEIEREYETKEVSDGIYNSHKEEIEKLYANIESLKTMIEENERKILQMRRR